MSHWSVEKLEAALKRHQQATNLVEKLAKREFTTEEKCMVFDAIHHKVLLWIDGVFDGKWDIYTSKWCTLAGLIWGDGIYDLIHEIDREGLT